MIPPDLAKRIAWYQEFMRPDDPELGNGIADWTITHEYRPDPTVDGEPVWGCMCSPGSLPDVAPLTAGDVAAKRAHIIIRLPKSSGDLVQVERTVLHELGHVLVAPMRSRRVGEEENAMHSLDALFAKLSPADARVFARAMHNPRARRYRVEGEDMAEEEKDAEKKPDGEVKKQDAGAPRDVAEIEVDLARAQMAGQPIDELAKELALALVARGTQTSAPAPEPEAPPAPQMGMTQEQAYARVKKAGEEAAQAQKEAIEAIIDANSHLDERQRVMVRKQSTAAAARELVATYPRVETTQNKTTMGMPGHPSANGEKLSVRARAMQASPEVMARIKRGTSAEDTGGLHLDVPGHTLAYSPAQHLAEQRHRLLEARRREREAVAS